MVRKILAKMLFCDVKDLHYVLLHIPVGVINVAIPIGLYLLLGLAGAIIGAALAVVFALVFVAYEVTEWLVVKDVIYPDLQGWLWGMGLGVVLAYVVCIL